MDRSIDGGAMSAPMLCSRHEAELHRAPPTVTSSAELIHNSFRLLRDERVLVTGASSFIGRHLVQYLRTSGIHVSTIDGRGDVDLNDVDAARTAVASSQPTLVFHLAALPDQGHASGDMSIAGATVRIAEHLANVVPTSARIVTVGSAKQYPMSHRRWHEHARPSLTTAYGRAKREAEDVITRQHPEATAVRLGPVYGGRQPEAALIPKAFQHFSKNESSFVVESALWAPLYLRDCLEALALSASTSAARGEIINVGGLRAYTVLEVAQHVARSSGWSSEAIRDNVRELPGRHQGL